MQRQLTAVFLAALCAFGLISPSLSATLNKRAVADVSPTAEELVNRTCYNSTPCGWMVYRPFSRKIDYFMKNTCECPKGKTCAQAEDDLSVSAYIHRCTEEEVVSPSDVTNA